MLVIAASGVAGSSEWTVFWIQLPVLVLAIAVIVVATTALRRSRPEDVPKVFAAFVAAFGPRRSPRHDDKNEGPRASEEVNE